MSSSINNYLERINKIPLLTHEEEILYGKQIQQMLVILRSKEQLPKDLDEVASLQSWADLHQLTIEQLRRNILIGERAKSIFIQSNIRLVLYIARKYVHQSHHLELLDLIQEGSIGLAKAVEKFDPTRGYKFSTYACWWIRQSINQSIQLKGREIKIPVRLHDKALKIRRVQASLSQELGRNPNTTELAIACDIKSGDLRQISTWMQQPYSLDLKVGDEKKTSLGDLVEYLGMEPEEYVDRQFFHENILKLLDILSSSQRQVIILRYGLEDGNPLTLTEVSQIMNLSRERVRQIQKRAISILRDENINYPNWDNN